MADITQWEYKAVDSTDAEELNKLGEKGWEAVAPVATSTGKSTQFMMKRPKQQQRSSDDGYGYGR